MRLVAEAGWVLCPGGVLRQDAGVVVDDGVVTAIDRLGALADVETDVRIGDRGCLALPGFVNAHQHGRADSTVSLGALDAPLECWLVSLLALPRSDPYPETVRLCRKLTASGVTTAVHSHYSSARSAEEFDQELRAILTGYRDGGVRGLVAADLRDRGQPVYGDEAGFLAELPRDLARRVESLVRRPPSLDVTLGVITRLRAEIATGALGDVELFYGPPGPPWCSDALLSRVAAAAEAEGARVHTHLLETCHELEFGLGAYEDGTVDALARLGLLNDRLFVAHGVWLDERDRAALARVGTSVVTNPSSNLRLHAGIAPVPELIAAGVNVALGTDNMALGDREEYLDELRLVRAIHRRPGVDGVSQSASSIFALGTENGGVAVGRSDIGALRRGARGDLVLVDLTRLRGPDVHVDPLELALAGAHADDLRAVVSGGRVVAENGISAIGDPRAEVAGSFEEVTETVRELLPYARAHYGVRSVQGRLSCDDSSPQ